MIKLFLITLFICSICGCATKYKIIPVYKWVPSYWTGIEQTDEIDYYIAQPLHLRPPLLTEKSNPIQLRDQVKHIEYLEQKQQYVMIFHYLQQIKVYLDLWHISPRVNRKYILEYIDKLNCPKETYVFRKEIEENGRNKATYDTYKRMYKEIGNKYQIFRFKNRELNKKIRNNL